MKSPFHLPHKDLPQNPQQQAGTVITPETTTAPMQTQAPQPPAPAPQPQAEQPQSPFATLPKEPQNPIERPNNGHRTMLLVISLTLLGLIIVAGIIIYIASFLRDL